MLLMLTSHWCMLICHCRQRLVSRYQSMATEAHKLVKTWRLPDVAGQPAKMLAKLKAITADFSEALTTCPGQSSRGRLLYHALPALHLQARGLQVYLLCVLCVCLHLKCMRSHVHALMCSVNASDCSLKAPSVNGHLPALTTLVPLTAQALIVL
jgi:hypothetical protein